MILRVCVDDGELLRLLRFAAQDFARGEIPLEVTQFFTLASMTAVRKPDGGERCIATGYCVSPSGGEVCQDSTSRRLRRCVCVHHFISLCRPVQGTDCVGHVVRAMTDFTSRTTVLSIDGVGAHDHVFRSSKLSKLHEGESFRSLLPVRSVCSQPSTHHWQDEGGARRVIRQCEGG